MIQFTYLIYIYIYISYAHIKTIVLTQHFAWWFCGHPNIFPTTKSKYIYMYNILCEHSFTPING